MKQNRLQQIKDVGQSIIDNAESILGTEKYRSGFVIRAEFEPHKPPIITIERKFLPEKLVDSLINKERTC